MAFSATISIRINFNIHISMMMCILRSVCIFLCCTWCSWFVWYEWDGCFFGSKDSILFLLKAQALRVESKPSILFFKLQNHYFQKNFCLAYKFLKIKMLFGFLLVPWSKHLSCLCLFRNRIPNHLMFLSLPSSCRASWRWKSYSSLGNL